VHAAGQVASFNLNRVSEPGQLLQALNGSIPLDMRVIDAAIAPETFHARRDARLKTYRYHLFTRKVMNPFFNRYAWHFPYGLDPERLAEDAALLLGTHDFSAFTVTSNETLTRTRTLTEASVAEADGSLFLTFGGNGFLRYMVRTLVSALLDVNRGRLKESSMSEILKSRDRHLTRAMAPAKGLTMIKVEY
jgi:tRNA pseudouridine38-40 synthase